METTVTPSLNIREKDINKDVHGSGFCKTEEEFLPGSTRIPEDNSRRLILRSAFPQVISFDNGDRSINNFSLPTNCHIVKEGTELTDLTRSAFHLMHAKVKQFGHPHVAGTLSAVFSPCNAVIEQVKIGCVKFVLRFNTKEDLQKFWDMYSSGELARRLTDVFITDELVPGDKTHIAVLPTFEQKDFEAGIEFFDNLEQAEKEAAKSGRLQKEENALSGEHQSEQGQKRRGTSDMRQQESPDTSGFKDSMEYSDEDK